VAHSQARLLAAHPALGTLPLSAQNTRAAALLRSGDAAAAAAAYQLLFARAARDNVTHPELHVCHANAAAACLRVGLFEEALRHAELGRRLAEAALRRTPAAGAGLLRALARKGQALLGLRRHREAAGVFEAGLKADPFNAELKAGLQRAQRGVLRDLQAGRGRETRAITFPDPSQRISYHPYAAPLHRVRTEDMLPFKLLTPFQAENDAAIKDTYNHMTVQADVRMPGRQLAAVGDAYATSAWRRAVEGAVAEIEGRDRDCRVLNLGAGAGVVAALALRAGARHVTAVERWLYLALACKDTLAANKVSGAAVESGGGGGGRRGIRP
jgi:protein arginine N-methyltransferase 7